MGIIGVLGALVNRIAQIIHPGKPREWLENVRLPSDYSKEQVLAALNDLAKGTPLAGWYERRSVVDLIKLAYHDDNPDEHASMTSRTKMASELDRKDYVGSPADNLWLFDQVVKAIQQRGIAFPDKD